MTIRPKDKLVTYVSRDLEPYRGFHVMMRALPDLLRARKDLRVVMVGGDGVSYGTPAKQGGLASGDAEGGRRPDRHETRGVSRAGWIPRLHLALLQRSDAHVYLTYPFVASWSLREALATGCAVIGSDTQPVREFITPGVNGLLTSFFDPPGLARTVLNVLEDAALSRRLRENARHYAERHLAMADYLAEYEALITRLTGMPLGAAREQSVVTPLRRPTRRARR